MRALKIDGERASWIFAIGIAVYAIALRLYFGAHIDLMPEETYYWNYSRHPDIGYLDHPPMVAWLIRCGTALFGNTEFGVRSGAAACAAVAAFFIFRLTRNLFGEASAVLALIMTQALPFFFLSGMLMTPDAPLTAAWAASLHFLERALIGGRARAWWWAGLCLGLGMLSKYTIGLLGLAALIFMLNDRQSRSWLRRWQPYAAALLAFAIFAPVIVWNAEHHWISFAFQTSRRLAAAPRFAFHKLVAASLVLMTPTIFVAAMIALTRTPQSAGAASADARRGARLLRTAVWVPLAVFAAFSLRREVKLDWTGASWVAALPLIAAEIIGAKRIGARGMRVWIRAAWMPTIVVMSLLYGAGLYYLAYGIAGVGYSKQIELLPVGWRQLGRRIDAVAQDYRRKTGVMPLVVGMDRYVMASELAFYGSDQILSVANTSSAHLFGGEGLMYEQWFPAKLQRGRTLLLVAWNANSLAADSIKSAVGDLGPVECGALTRDGREIRDYCYRIGRDYRGPPSH